MSRYAYSGGSDYKKYTPKTHPWRGKTFIGYSPGTYQRNGKPYCPNSWIMHLSDDPAKGLTVMNRREELEALVASYGASLEWHGTQSGKAKTINLDNAEDNKTAFIKRLMKSGWTRKEATAEWESIQEDEEGQL